LQAKTGQHQAAVLSYRRVLELDPKHADAANSLRKHDPKTAAGKAGGI
jgi:predicted TPR repeat methyltransferase